MILLLFYDLFFSIFHFAVQFFFPSNYVEHVQLILSTLSSNLFELVQWFGSINTFACPSLHSLNPLRLRFQKKQLRNDNDNTKRFYWPL